MFTAVDLFAGCGGLSKGFENAGFAVLAAFENWSTAADCYELNFSHPVHRTDLSSIEDAVELIQSYNPDIIIGGPPCQDFSHAGKRVEADRASLTDSFAKIIAMIRPKYFVMENVDRAQNSRAYASARTIFKNAEYGLTEIVLLASRCGVPQRRKRFFCIGVLGGQDGELADLLNADLSQREMTMRDYFGDTLDLEYYYRHPRNYSRRGIFSIDEPAPTMRGVNRPVPQGYPGHPNDACPVSASVRALTTLERSLVQTFPADYKWTGNKTDREQMVGNAVPVKLAQYVAAHLKTYIDTRASKAVDDKAFRDWLKNDKGLSERTCNDVVSRIKRADRISPIGRCGIDEYLTELGEEASFIELSSSVKSQMKRSLKLLIEYLDNAA